MILEIERTDGSTDTVEDISSYHNEPSGALTLNRMDEDGESEAYCTYAPGAWVSVTVVER